MSSSTTSEAAAKPSGRKVPRHVWRGSAIFFVFVFATFLLMANDAQIWHGPLYGILAMMGATLGLLDAFGILKPANVPTDLPRVSLFSAQEGEPDWMAPKMMLPLAIVILIGGSVVFGFHQLPFIIVASLLALGVSAIRRPALLVFVMGSLLILPMLGSYGLWDPWETHYGEVSREILSRDDWISLWWANENWFWSKPIFIFWFEALTMGVLGFNYHPMGNPAHPEWALRLPVYFIAIGALLAVYSAISRSFGKRAGVLCATVLATMPHFFLLSHQAITDMHFVGTMIIAMACFMLAVCEDPTRVIKEYRVGPFVWSGRHTMIAVVTMIALPQALYLASRNIAFQAGFLFAWHRDQFIYGSPGNSGATPETSITGDPILATNDPAFNGIATQPIVQGLIWALGISVVLYFIFREKRARSLFMFGFYVFCGLAFMAKGIPGFALPGLVALLYLIASRRWGLLLDGHLRVALGILIVVVTGLPWFVAMYMRHGPAFTDRLLVHDHLARLTSGVHGDNGPIDYFMAQLGPGMFPWIALAPAALTIFLHMKSKHTAVSNEPSVEANIDPRRDMTTLIALWFVGAFVLFNAMVTKFHHYIFPAVPPVAILVGLVVDRMLGDTDEVPLMTRVWTMACGIGAAACSVLGIGGLIGDVRGAIPFETPGAERQDWVLEHKWNAAISIGLIAIGIGLAFIAARALRRNAKTNSTPVWQIAGVGTALACAPVVAAFVGRDLSWVTTQHPYGYERLIHLFVYNYGRAWPDVFDYRPILTGFGFTATLFLVLAVFRALRPIATRALLGVALCFAVWSLDVYLIDLSPHWGQKEVIQQYFQRRRSPDDPLVAWQMNWKGENFYTGNHVEKFVDLDNAKFRQWIERHRGAHAFVMFEHSRMESFRSLVSPRVVTPVTGMRENNKFLMVELDL
jgi:4-amino-4-deoxy-L-arabinose transferase-like glycosyltransferase